MSVMKLTNILCSRIKIIKIKTKTRIKIKTKTKQNCNYVIGLIQHYPVKKKKSVP